MNGREVLLVLTHMFRKKGSPVGVDTAVEFLSFKCRYGAPTNIRRLLSIALQNEMISREGDEIRAEFMYDLQTLSPNQAIALSCQIHFKDTVDPLH